MFARTPGRTPGDSDADQIIPLSTLGDSTRVSVAAQDSRMSQATLLPPPPPELLSILPPHWNRIKPSGQVYLATENIKTAAGPFSMLPDELIVQLLEYLDILSILRFGSTCKALWAFSRLDEPLWRSKFLNCPTASDRWCGDWFSTVLEMHSRWVFDCSGLYSDVLYRPFMCRHIPLKPYYKNIPSKNQIPRIDTLTAEEFESKWVKKPFIATKVVNEWPVIEYWTWGGFMSMYKDVNFSCEGVDWPYETYRKYCTHNFDESPLYLFDPAFVEKMDLKIGKHRYPHDHYEVPECFGQDYFEVLGEQRPDHRWLIVGPERSGSTFHKDPNATSAWNAVVRGAKYWIMFPKAPPGVFTSQDQSEVTSPLSIGEWLLGFHAEARKMDGCVEGVCRAGEILHVPSGWYHLVINIEGGIAITQNFVPQAYLHDALGFMKYKSEQVTGFKGEVNDPYKTFILRLRERYPEVLDEALEKMEKKHGLKKRKWDELVKGDSEPDSDMSNPQKKAQVREQVERWKDRAPEKTKAEETVKCCFSFCFGAGESSDEEVP